MSYQVLARTWRPQPFDDLLGQEPVVRTLSNALTSSTLGHAYLFSGLRGVGKTTAARLLAKAVNCVNGPTATPCGECPSCVEIAAGSSLDMVEIDGGPGDWKTIHRRMRLNADGPDFAENPAAVIALEERLG